jgi:hypothetical protein
MTKFTKSRAVLIVSLTIVALLAMAGLAWARTSVESPLLQPDSDVHLSAADIQSALFNVHLDIPQGSRIDYLRVFYYDTSSNNSTAWITTYDGAGSFSDLTYVLSEGNSGYGTNLSDYVGHVVDTTNDAYVLNWRSSQPDSSLRLCGLRVAYHLPEGGGFSSTFSYAFVAGSALHPVDSDTGWNYDYYGCVSARIPHVYLPMVIKNV